MTRGRKRILWVLGAITGFLLIAAASLPVWLPWILPAISSRLGLHYDRYSRIGYGRFALHGASFSNGVVRFNAGRIETAMPAALVWNRSRGGSELRITDWNLALSEKPKKSEGPGTNTPAATVARVEQTAERFAKWIERAALSNGVVTFQQHTVSVPSLVWEPPVVHARVVAGVPKLGDLPLELWMRTGPSNLQVQINAPKYEIRSALEAQRDAGLLIVRTTNSWGTNQIFASARFTGGALPQTAELSAPAIHIPVTNVPALGYTGVDGSIRAGWTNRSFALQLTFDAQSTRTNIPPISGMISARGDTNSAAVQLLEISSTSMRAVLSRPMQFSYAGELLSGPARLSVTGDLAQLPFPGIAGTFSGHVDAHPSTNAFAAIDSSLTLSDVTARNIEVATAKMNAQLRWPVVRITELTAASESGARVRFSGQANVTNRHIHEASLRLEGQLPTNFIPGAVQYSNLVVIADASGPISNIAHQISASAYLPRVGPLQPLQVQLAERGAQFRIDHFRGTASSPGAMLDMVASGEWSSGSVTAQLSRLSYWRGDTNAAPLYALADPVNLRFAPQSNAAPTIHVAPMHLRGKDRRISLQADLAWPTAGSSRIAVEGLRSSDFTNLLTSPVPVEIVVPELNAAMEWSNGPVRVAFDTTSRIITTAAPPVQLTFTGTNSADAVYVNRLILTADDKLGPLLTGDARLPLSAVSTNNGIAIGVHSNAPMRLELHTFTNKALSTLLEQFTGIKAVQPSVQISFSGTPAQPRGTAQIAAASLDPGTLTNKTLPRVENISADIAFNPSSVRLNEFRAAIAGQPLTATAEIPLANTGDWTSRAQVDKASADIQMKSADLAAFAPFATNVLAPRGNLDVSLALRPGRQLSGYINVTNAATVTIPSVGPIHDIDAAIQLRNSAAIIKSVQARAGGAPLTITGVVDFARWEPGTNRWPDIQVRILGTNVSIVREAQKIIRANVHLQITNVAQKAPAIGGAVTLRDSLYLANLADLVPRGVKKPRQRPPYFSVDAELLRDWPLDVHVQGEKFLTVRSPVFRGEVSANLDVRGRLGEPLALGQVRINSGRLSFPFATLSIKQGFVTLGSANPYAPELFVTATGRAYDYDIRLEVTGSAQEPVLEFTSTPPLTSEQVLLMATSGQIPRSDFTLSTDQRAQKLGMFVGKNLLSELGFGGGDSLTVRSGESISERGRSTYSVEYKLTEDVSLVGEYDRFDEYNAGVQWRVFSK